MLHDDILRFAASVNTGYLHSFGEKATHTFIQLLNPADGEQLLELGCGTGYTTVQVLSISNVFVHAAEAKPEMLKATENNVKAFGLGDRCKFYKTPHGEPLPFKNETFDKIYWEGVLALQSTSDFDLFLREVYRTLKKGGICVMNETMWLKGVSKELVDDWNRYNEQHVNLRSSTQLPWGVEDWLEHFSAAGFEVQKNVLISEAIKENNGTKMPGASVRAKMSLTKWASRGKKILSPAHAYSNWKLKKKLQRFQDGPQVLEARFFVLKKS
jgi:ubiquinone/menaquinone biosynthesis C-methylase UbiE